MQSKYWRLILFSFFDIFNDRRPSQPNNQWKKELERQNDAILNNVSR